MICQLCPHNCQIDRQINLGYCKAPADFKIAHMQLHHWEEPIISGSAGSGTIFFSHCNLKCVFCQNYNISQEYFGKIISKSDFLALCQKLKNQGAHNLNLVSPTPYTHLLIELLPQIKLQTNLPIIWNSNAYEKTEILRKLRNKIDVYLPDFKYADNNLALKYSQINNYTEFALAAIKEMIEQQPDIEIDEYGIIKQGVIIRHLVLPGQIENSKKVLQLIKNNFGQNIWVSLMMQYYPAFLTNKYPEIDRALNQQEYYEISKYFKTINFKGGYLQKLSTDNINYTPIWKLETLIT